MIKLSPSILSADFSCIGSQIAEIERAGVDMVHLDVMDGHFVPNISIGLPVIESLRKNSKLVFDSHLMIADPMNYADRFAQAGSDIITFHIEACQSDREVLEVIRTIKLAGKRPGLSLNPDTDIQSIFKFLEHIDFVLVMSVNPGFGGQSFIKKSLQRASELRNYANTVGINSNPDLNLKLNLDIQMDGGINISNVRDVINAGVNIIVVGSAIFSHPTLDIFNAAKEYIDIFEEYNR